jgi:hypothetical protein
MDSEIKQMCQQKLTTVMLEPVWKVLESVESVMILSVAAESENWGLPCGPRKRASNMRRVKNVIRAM